MTNSAEDFDGWDLEASFVAAGYADFDRWELLATISDLEAELVEAQRPTPISGGPPPEWDRLIRELPDSVFLVCLGPSDRLHRRSASPRARIASFAPKPAARQLLVPSW